jgi:hypothetical protein
MGLVTKNLWKLLLSTSSSRPRLAHCVSSCLHRLPPQRGPGLTHYMGLLPHPQILLLVLVGPRPCVGLKVCNVVHNPAFGGAQLAGPYSFALLFSTIFATFQPTKASCFRSLCENCGSHC